MINHKFYLYNESERFDPDSYDEKDFIRVSAKFISKIRDQLQRHKFFSYVFEDEVYGLCENATLLYDDDIEFFKCCLTSWDKEKEYKKIINFLNRALLLGDKIIHIDGSYGTLVHEFVLCSKIPEVISFKDFKTNTIKIQDQFINENYDIFKKINYYWWNLNNLESGFNYHGITIISPKMAAESIFVINNYLSNNDSEKACYFLGDENDTIQALFKKSIKNNEYIIHFGV